MSLVDFFDDKDGDDVEFVEVDFIGCYGWVGFVILVGGIFVVLVVYVNMI